MANAKKGRLVDGDNRETPGALFERLHAEHHFTLDAAADAQNAKLPRFNSQAEPDRFSWTGARVWLNPPYSDIGTWVVRAWMSDAALVYMLVPNWTDRKWWLELVEPFRDGRGDAPKSLRTDFLGRHRFLYQGKPILTESGKVGTPEFGLVGLTFGPMRGSI